MKNILRQTIETERALTFSLNSILIVIVAVIVLSIVQYVFGSDDSTLVLAQCLRAECDTCSSHKQEPAAILHVLRKGAETWNRNNTEKRTIADQARAYCSVFDKSSSRYYGHRAIAIRASTFAVPLHGSVEWWATTRDLVDRFERGLVADPTIAANHFGGKMDVRRAKRNNWHLVAKMSNWFWRAR